MDERGTQDYLLLRFGEHLSPDADTIQQHVLVLRKRGYVWYGKLGQKLSHERLNRVVSRCLETGEPCVYLASSSKADRRFFALVVDQVCYGDMSPGELDAVPQYMRTRSRQVSAWLRVRALEPVDPDVMNGFVVTSSGNPLRLALSTSTSATMYISPGRAGGDVLSQNDDNFPATDCDELGQYASALKEAGIE